MSGCNCHLVKEKSFTASTASFWGWPFTWVTFLYCWEIHMCGLLIKMFYKTTSTRLVLLKKCSALRFGSFAFDVDVEDYASSLGWDLLPWVLHLLMTFLTNFLTSSSHSVVASRSSSYSSGFIESGIVSINSFIVLTFSLRSFFVAIMSCCLTFQFIDNLLHNYFLVFIVIHIHNTAHKRIT